MDGADVIIQNLIYCHPIVSEFLDLLGRPAIHGERNGDAGLLALAGPPGTWPGASVGCGLTCTHICELQKWRGKHLRGGP